ncbi:MAG: hypothetical protein LBH39_07185 [Clostridiales Family XIII bacterium]|jgi:hypothetical protein|nr:hypothetical protein [Clostridiales Family XIII bacterium]
MGIEVLQKYAHQHWDDNYRASFTKLSKIGDGPNSLVYDDTQLYNFDQICKGIFNEKGRPTSADGLALIHDGIAFIEFKSGFAQKMTEKKTNPKLRCERIQDYCENGNVTALFEKSQKLLKKNRELEQSELLKSIRFKAIESYISLEKRILPECFRHAGTTAPYSPACVCPDPPANECHGHLSDECREELEALRFLRKLNVKLFVVIDETGHEVDAHVDMLAVVAETASKRRDEAAPPADRPKGKGDTETINGGLKYKGDAEAINGVSKTPRAVPEDHNNPFMSIRGSLKRLRKQNRPDGNKYYYDEIDVMSAQEFRDKLPSFKRKMIP